MMKISIVLRVLGLVLIWCHLMVSPAFSAECLDKSPTAATGKNPYGPMEIRELNQGELEMTRRLLKSLDGQWKGRAEEVACNPADSEEKEVRVYSIKAKAKTDHYGNFFMKIELYSAKERTTHQKTLRFYIYENLLRINHDNGTGDVEIISLTKQKIELRRRALLRNKHNRGGIHKEFFFEMNVGPDGFSVSRDIYTQNRLSEQHLWTFSKR